MSQVKSKQRVADHGEVFTPAWMVEAMLDGRDWILGEPSLADFGIFGSLSPLLTIGEAIPSAFPRLANWAARIQALGRKSG